MLSRYVRWCAVSVCSVLLLDSAFGQAVPLRSTPLSPAESLACIELQAGFSVQVIAHEPQVIDPVDAAFDARGRLWVVEMRDYPYPTDKSPSGCIRILTDNDGDSRFESSVVFADQLDMPTGLALWKDGAVVTLAGQVVWFRDTDGDSKADSQQIWIEGFSRDNEQLRANHPRLGPDGWWYIASGLRGGNVIAGPDFRSPSDQPLNLGSRDVRFHPQLKKLEPITGPAQFGLCFDSNGNRIFCSNRNPAVMVRFEQSDLIGNPLAGLIPSVVDLIPAGDQSQVFPLVNAWTTSNLHSGQFTAACGVLWHPFPHEAALGRSRIFACEPTGSLVHSSMFDQSLTPTPASESSGQEWLASRDPWFRPVNLVAAPGGILVIDMHRAVIEHPQWVPDELKKRVDERWGNDCGRIFFISEKPTSQPTSANARPLADQAAPELLQNLASPDPWTRETSRRLLIERGVHSIDTLSAIATHQEHPPVARIAALQLAISSTSQLASSASQHSTQFHFLRDLISNAEPSSEVRQAAMRAASKISDDIPDMLEAVMQAAGAGDQRLLIEALRYVASRETPLMHSAEQRIIQQLTKHFADDSSIAQAERTAELLVLAAHAFRSKPELLNFTLLSGLKTQKDAGKLNEIYATAAQRLAIASLEHEPNIRFAELFRTASQSLYDPGVVKPGKLYQTAATAPALAILHEMILLGRAKPAIASPSLDALMDEVSFWPYLRELITSPDTAIDARRRAVAILAQSPHAQDQDLLRQLAQAGDLPLRTAALRAWSTTADEACDQYLLNELSSSSPQLQQVIVELIAQRPARLAALSARLADGSISAKRIGAIELKKLAQRARGDVQKQLNVALATIENSDRAKVVADYQASLTMAADPKQGKEVFAKHCASCHRIDDLGVQVGPDISDSRTQQPAQLLTNILDPNRAIDNNYFRFVALTNDDQVVEGMIAEETSETIVLRSQNNVRTVLKRTDLQDLKATGISLMPEGLEAQIDQAAMAHLISYIKNWRYKK